MRLNNKVEIIVPTKQGKVNIDEEEVTRWVEYILKEYSILAGGASVIEQKGAWVSDSDGLVLEKNYLIYAYVTEADLKSITSLTRVLGYEMEDKLEQDSIMYVVNGEARFT